jgi:hypothetical protein
MPKKNTTRSKKRTAAKQAVPKPLKGWKAIADYLGQPISVAQRWGRSGMPIRREGRYTVATPEDLSRWLGRESGTGEQVHIAAEADTDLAADLRRSLSAAKGKPGRTRK